MARTAPIPNIPAIPGMCPGVAVLGGGGAGGGSGGKGAGKGGGGVGAAGEGGADGTAADGRSAGSPDPKKHPHCGTRSCPVDVVTGRVFTLEATDLELPGPLPLRFFRVYSSTMRKRDVGLGYGWAHTFGWEIEIRRRDIRVWNDQGAFLTFDPLDEGAEQQGHYGWVLRRTKRGYVLDTDEGVWRHFEQQVEANKHKRTRERWRLSRMEDRNGNTIALRYNDKGHVTEITDSAGRVIRTCVDAHGHFQKLQVKNTTSRGKWVDMATYAYGNDSDGNDGNNDAGHLLSVTDADGFANTYAYSDKHRLTENGYKCGIVFHFVYDDIGRCVESWGAYSNKRDASICLRISTNLTTLSDGKTLIKGVHHCRYEYFADSYTEVHDSTRTTYYQGNPLGLLDKTVIGSGVTTVDYREDGFVMAETDELGHTTVYTRDARGRVESVTDPLGHTTSYHRDTAGLVVAMTDPEGHTTDLSRDERGNLLTIQWPDDSAESRSYDTRGLVTEVFAANGSTTRLRYDSHANLATIAQPNGGEWRYEYDGFGRRLSATNPTGAQTTYSYTSRGDLVALRDAIGGTARYSYDGDGQLLQYVNPKGAITKLRWAGLHKLVARVDANRNVVRMRYNHEGELARVINEAGEEHMLHRDGVGILTGETTFDGRELRYRYDLAGQVVRAESGAQEWTDFNYDAAGRLVARELHDGVEETFAYNGRSELIRAENAAGSFAFERDALGRTVRESQTIRGKEHWVDVSYDANGERIGRSTSLGHREEVVRDAMGARTRTVLDGEHEVTHSPDLLGREVARTLAKGGRIESDYDPLGRLSKRLTYDAREQRRPAPGQPDWVGKLAPGAGTQASYRYDWDGELVGMHDTIRGNTEYRYDPVGQLLAMVPEQARKELFKYDAGGNLAEADGREDSRVYGAGNRLERKDDTYYVWDDDGRLVEKRTPGTDGANDEVWRYTWNGAGLLQVVDRPDGGQVQFKYDPFARRVSKTLYLPQNNRVLKAREHTRFVWDGDVLAHEIYLHANEAGDPIVEERTYLFEDESFVPLAHKQGGRWVHYVNDQIGTPERLIDERGEVVCEMRRAAWGRVEVVKGATADTALRFQGQYADGETGLSYNRWRYFDAESGRFYSSDPIGLVGGINTCRYAINPVGDTDPLGLARARNAQQELRRLGPLTNRPQAEIARDLESRGFRSCVGTGGGTVWTKPMPKGQTAVVRLDPPMQRPNPRGFADEVPHAHKEIVPTAAVNRRGNFEPRRAATLDDAAQRTNDPRRTHIPTG